MITSSIVAVDGTAASGKGTLASRIAQHLNFAYLDTGILYRAVGYSVIKNGHKFDFEFQNFIQRYSCVPIGMI